MTLNNLKVGECCVVKKIKDSSKIKRRLLDIGLIPGTIIECVLSSPSKDSLAYLIRGSMFAIRNIDSKEIEVSINE